MNARVSPIETLKMRAGSFWLLHMRVELKLGSYLASSHGTKGDGPSIFV